MSTLYLGDPSLIQVSEKDFLRKNNEGYICVNQPMYYINDLCRRYSMQIVNNEINTFCGSILQIIPTKMKDSKNFDIVEKKES
jgi:hypothetical protein